MTNEYKKDQDEQQAITWGGFLNEFLWVCAGVNRKVLRQCPTDYAKYAGIGGTILFTALMAMLSGGYALYTVFDDKQVAVAFGIFWGLLIFNLDRFIVNTMYSDGKVTISWGELGAGMPRIIMAIFLGIVISTPLELKIFEDEIEVTIGEMKQNKIRQYQAADQSKLDSLRLVRENRRTTPLASGGAGALILTGNQQNDMLVNQIKGKEAELANFKNTEQQAKERLKKAHNRSDSIILQHIIASNRAKANKAKVSINSLNSKLAAVNADYKKTLDAANNERYRDLTDLDKQINEVMTHMQEGKEYKDKVNKTYGGFQAHMSAFNKMKSENPSTNICSIFIMLLFIIIETAPTFFKMMIAAGPYDDLLRAEMHRIKILAEHKISDINDEVNTEVQISTDKNRHKLEVELQANKQLLEQLASAQSELLCRAIELWRQEELQKIEQNPSKYIMTNTNTSKNENTRT